MPRFFVSKNLICNNVVNIEGDDARHIARSLRMAVGDEITVSDGEGTEYACRLTKIRDELCEAELLEERHGAGEPSAHIVLYMAYPKGDKLEVVIQKAVELGASEIVPFESERCIKRPKAEKIEKQTARLQRIAEEAAKQCGRSKVPTVLPPASFKSAIEQAASCELSLFCYEGESDKSLKNALSSLSSPKSISLIVGSEGGFSPEEAEYAAKCGCTSVSLGKRILRCETAPLFVLSALSYIFEL